MFYSLFVELISFHTINTRTIGGGMKASLWLEYDNKQKHVKFSAKNIKAKFIVCYFWVTRVITLACYCIVTNDP